MPRKVRVEFAGECYHVVNRGNYRKELFGRKGAAASFEQCLGQTCGRFGWQIHAFSIMRNHFHLAVETPEPNLSEGMKWLQGTWAVRFNRFQGEKGRPFQGRYKAWHVESDTAEGWRCYCQYLALLAEEHPLKREERFAELTRGWAIGSATFALEMHERLMAQQPNHPILFSWVQIVPDSCRCERRLGKRRC